VTHRVEGPILRAEMSSWSPESWRARPAAQLPTYPDDAALEAALIRLRNLPPLVTSWEIQRLKGYLADAQRGDRFVLQGGDCAEMFEECQPEPITRKLKILLQMSLVLVHSMKRPVVRIGRFAGQYAKPRSKPVETRQLNGSSTVLPSYFGDLVNGFAFEEASRTPDPQRLIAGYQHAALTLNFIRSLSAGGFADVHHPEYWDLSFFEEANLDEHLRAEYTRTSRSLAEALRFMAALDPSTRDELARVEFFTSHEGLHLPYEAALTRSVPRRDGHWDLSAHMLWIGDRTRQLDGAHVEFFRGVENPIGIKCGPSLPPEDLPPLIEALNPEDEPGKIVLITRLGAGHASDRLPPLIEAVRASGRTVLWITDPMHGNTRTTARGVKTRVVGDVFREIEVSADVHEAEGTHLGGVHFELTGDDVTECLGGAENLTEDDLTTNYASACDPRLNYRQALELAFAVARRLHVA
jgi:3-deoxy-7-phosphoheptulonate synthase